MVTHRQQLEASLGGIVGGVCRAPPGVGLLALAFGRARAVRFSALCSALAWSLAPHVPTCAYPFVALFVSLSRPSVWFRREDLGVVPSLLGACPKARDGEDGTVLAVGPQQRISLRVPFPVQRASIRVLFAAMLGLETPALSTLAFLGHCIVLRLRP